jgi:hypothetical protein
MIIEKGPSACFMRDKKGYLPVHVACTRHCSPEKLDMLLTVNPASLLERTGDGATILQLAKSNKTASHPNQTLIEDIERRLEQARRDWPNFILNTEEAATTPTDSSNSVIDARIQSHYAFRNRLDSNDSAKVSESSDDTCLSSHVESCKISAQTSGFVDKKGTGCLDSNQDINDVPRSARSNYNRGPIRKRKVRDFTKVYHENNESPDSDRRREAQEIQDHSVVIQPNTMNGSKTLPKGAASSIENSPAQLLLHFSQNGSSQSSDEKRCEVLSSNRSKNQHSDSIWDE